MDKDLVYTTLDDAQGFSLKSFREANSVRIFIKTDKEVTPIFKAYYQGMFSFNVELENGDFGSDVNSFLNQLGPVWRSTLNSIGTSISNGGWSGAFAAPVKPYIKGTRPLSFNIKCVLPLIVNGDGTDSYQKNIANPIADLLGVTMPWKSNATQNVIDTVNQAIDNFVDYLFEGSEGSSFWTCIQNWVKNLKTDFFGGIYMLNNPIQYDNKNSLILRIGPWRVSDIIIDTVNVEFPPSFYRGESLNMNEVYPPCAYITIACKSKAAATPDILRIYQNMSPTFQQIVNEKDFVK